MAEPELARMKLKPLFPKLIQREIAVLVVADDRVARVRQVNADLVRAAGLKFDFQQAELHPAFQPPRAREPGQTALAHAHPALARASHVLMKRLTQLQRLFCDLAFDEGEVDSADLAFAQHAVKLRQGAALLAKDKEARRVAVEPVRELERSGLRTRGAH